MTMLDAKGRMKDTGGLQSGFERTYLTGRCWIIFQTDTHIKVTIKRVHLLISIYTRNPNKELSLTTILLCYIATDELSEILDNLSIGYG